MQRLGYAPISKKSSKKEKMSSMLDEGYLDKCPK
jgi:hypothetical protein